MSIVFAMLSNMGCSNRPVVVRIIDGQTVQGRFVHPEAYALVMEGQLAEQRGWLAQAERLYLAALRYQPNDASILVRLGALRCAWNQQTVPAAQKTFADALKVDRFLVSAYVERGRCALRHGMTGQAEQDARRALSLAPSDWTVTVLFADVLEKGGKSDMVAAVLDGFAFLYPSYRSWQAIDELARRHDDRVHRQMAASRLGQAGSRRTVAQVDDALARGDLANARQFAAELHLESGQLAVRAAALGQWEAARQQARMVLAAEPGHPDATAVFLSAPSAWESFQQSDPVIWQRLLKSPENNPRRLSDLAALVLADAIRRTIGMQAARSWLARWNLSYDIYHEPLAHPLLIRLGVSTEPR
ncbi:MAG TPA: hypothetical protein PKL73_22445 [Polyangiaceae bacterium]|nr:hypothetical protein [Polyangiaceae bacterium]